MSAIISRERYAREIAALARDAQAKALLAPDASEEPESAASVLIVNVLKAMAQKKNPAG